MLETLRETLRETGRREKGYHLLQVAREHRGLHRLHRHLQKTQRPLDHRRRVMMQQQRRRPEQLPNHIQTRSTQNFSIMQCTRLVCMGFRAWDEKASSKPWESLYSRSTRAMQPTDAQIICEDLPASPAASIPRYLPQAQ